MRRKVLYAGLLVAVGVAAGAKYLEVTLEDQSRSGPSRPLVVEIDTALFPNDEPEPRFAAGAPLISQMSTQAQMETDAYKRWMPELREPVRYHNKMWEFAFILQALEERGLLQAGKRGLGFGVGQEPLPAVFATHGVEILATDLDVEEAARLGWVAGNQHMSSRDVLNKKGIAPKDVFERLVTVRSVDMNHIPSDLAGFDFTWSSCSLGHLGNLEKGLAFVENSLATLKPGGIAVHTTEINLSSNSSTYETEGTSIYRRKDIEELVRRLTARGHEIRVNFNYGHGELDRHIDQPPYDESKRVKFRLDRFAVTSLGLLIRKNPAAAP